MEEHNYAPFYAGQEVVAVKAVEGSRFKNGNDYVVSAIEYKINPANGTGPYWYIGIVGHNNGEAWFDPKIFAPKQTVQFVKFEQIEMSVN
jgi:hypothetical protein